MVCPTCLNPFRLIDKAGVGIMGGMPDLPAAQAGAAEVITL